MNPRFYTVTVYTERSITVEAQDEAEASERAKEVPPEEWLNGEEIAGEILET